MFTGVASCLRLGGIAVGWFVFSACGPADYIPFLAQNEGLEASPGDYLC